jgi:hypothetical protein
MSNLTFKDLKTDKLNEIVIGGIEVEVTYPDGRPAAGAQYELKLTPGGTRTGTLDGNGRLSETNIPEGAKAELKIIGAPVIALAE